MKRGGGDGTGDDKKPKPQDPRPDERATIHRDLKPRPGGKR